MKMLGRDAAEVEPLKIGQAELLNASDRNYS